MSISHRCQLANQNRGHPVDMSCRIDELQSCIRENVPKYFNRNFFDTNIPIFYHPFDVNFATLASAYSFNTRAFEKEKITLIFKC